MWRLICGGDAYTENCLKKDYDLYIQTYISSVLNVKEVAPNNFIKIYPNPSNDFIKISGLKKSNKYTIYNLLGNVISNGVISNNEKVNIKNLSNGIYFLRFKNGNAIKFIKE